MHLKAFVLVLLTICSTTLFAQEVHWLDRSIIVHDRINDLKWHEVFITTNDSTTILIDSTSPGIKGLIAPDDTDFGLQHGNVQKKISFGPGKYHFYIFHLFTQPLPEGQIFLRVNNDSIILQAKLNLDGNESNEHPLDNPPIHVFPKISSGLFKIDMSSYRNAEVIVYDEMRSVVHETDWNGRILDLRGLKSGRYFIQVNNEEFPVEIKNISEEDVKN